MANLPVIDATGGTVYMKATGAGTNPDPYVPLQGGGTVNVAGTVPVSVQGTAAVIDAALIALLPTSLSGSGNFKVAIAENSANSDPATGARQTTGNTSLSSIDSKLTDVATQTTLAALNTKIPASPATAGNQTTANTSLSSIDGKLTDVATQTTLAALNIKVPSQGQALAGASMPVVLPAAQITTLTPLGTVAISGGTINSVGGTVNTLQLNNGTVSVSNLPATQPISGTVGVSSGTVSISGTVAVSGAGGGTQYAEDAAHVSGDLGTMALGVRSDTAAALAGTTGDYQPMIFDASGRLWVNPQGNVASGASDSGNPVKVGGVYNTTLPALTNGQRGDIQLDAQGNQRMNGGWLEVTGTVTGTTLADIFSTDVSGYRFVSVQLTGFGSATVQFEASNDNTNWLNVPLFNINTQSTVTSTTAAGVFYGVLPARYFRARVSVHASGSIVGTAEYSTIPGPSVTATTSGVGLAGIYSGGSFNAIGSGTNADGDAGGTPLRVFPQQALWNGASWDRQRGATVFKVVALTAATTETTIWTPTSGKKFRLMGFLLTCGAASTLTFKDNTSGTTIFATRGLTDTPIGTPPMQNGILSAAANNVLTVTRGTSCTLDGVVWGTEE